MVFGSIGRALLSAAALLSLCAAAHAAGDAVRGQKKFYTCYGCHGIDDYKNAYPDYSVPKLHHQHAAYVIAALHEYRNGERPHATMHAQAASMSDEDIEDIAAYLQGPEPIKPSSAIVGTTPQQAATCVACHGVNGQGIDAPLEPKPPVLAGQHEDYLEQALTAYRKGRRKNPVMSGMAQALPKDEDIKVLATYFSRQTSALSTAHATDK